MSTEIIEVTRYRWKCDVPGCFVEEHGPVGTYATRAEAQRDAKAHDRVGHRPDGTSKQTIGAISL